MEWNGNTPCIKIESFKLFLAEISKASSFFLF